MKIHLLGFFILTLLSSGIYIYFQKTGIEYPLIFLIALFVLFLNYILIVVFKEKKEIWKTLFIYNFIFLIFFNLFNLFEVSLFAFNKIIFISLNILFFIFILYLLEKKLKSE